MRLVLWADALHAAPTPEQVMEQFTVSRATAHRLLNSYFDAKGEMRPRKPSPMQRANYWTPERRKKLSDSLKRYHAKRKFA